MRSDIDKVVHETYRYGRSLITKPGRAPREADDLPTRQGMRVPYKGGWGSGMKEMRLNRSPLRRFLLKQVGKKWDAVFSEISRTVDHRSATGHAVIEQVLNLVATRELLEEDGQVWEYHHYGRFLPTGFYVHPRTGVLAFTQPEAYRRHWPARAEDEVTEKAISPSQKVAKMGDVWYSFEMAPVTPERYLDTPIPQKDGSTYHCKVLDRDSLCYDLFLERQVNGPYAPTYNRPTMYAKSKRQLSHKEKKKFGLL